MYRIDSGSSERGAGGGPAHRASSVSSAMQHLTNRSSERERKPTVGRAAKKLAWQDDCTSLTCAAAVAARLYIAYSSRYDVDSSRYTASTSSSDMAADGRRPDASSSPSSPPPPPPCCWQRSTMAATRCNLCCSSSCSRSSCSSRSFSRASSVTVSWEGSGACIMRWGQGRITDATTPHTSLHLLVSQPRVQVLDVTLTPHTSHVLTPARASASRPGAGCHSHTYRPAAAGCAAARAWGCGRPQLVPPPAGEGRGGQGGQ